MTLGERHCVWLHRELLCVVPRGCGQLVDRGFSFSKAASERLVQSFFPTFAKDASWTPRNLLVIDAKTESATDRCRGGVLLFMLL